jgi:hypothetical protein
MYLAKNRNLSSVLRGATLAQLGAAGLAAAASGCGPKPAAALCQRVCDCRGCESDFQAAENVAATAMNDGCAAKYDDWAWSITPSTTTAARGRA